jgi:hypothetical protein
VMLKRTWNSVVPTAGRASARMAGRSGPSVIPAAAGGASGGAASC